MRRGRRLTLRPPFAILEGANQTKERMLCLKETKNTGMLFSARGRAVMLGWELFRFLRIT